MFFILWDELFTQQAVWGFNSEYITGFKLGNLPIEEILFFVCVPYSCIFIYEVCKAYITKDILIKSSNVITWLLILLCVLLCLLYFDKTYTIVNASICLILLIVTKYYFYKKDLGKFYLSYLISLIPFLLCNGILTALPIVTYNDAENMGIRIFTIPFEDSIYCLSLLILPALLMQYFENKYKKK